MCRKIVLLSLLLFQSAHGMQTLQSNSQFLPLAIQRGVGLIAMKPLASGSIMQLDPRARPEAKPEFARLQLFGSRVRPILPAAVAELTKSLDRMPDETLCQSAAGAQLGAGHREVSQHRYGREFGGV